VGGIGKIWVVSDDSKAVHETLGALHADLGQDRIKWVSEKSYPFSWADVDQHMHCKSSCGWYLQQLLKMYARRALSGIRDYLVVDAGIVWFGHGISVVADRGKNGLPTTHFYSTAGQHHGGYYEHIRRLAGEEVARVNPKISGVVHHMVFKLDVLEALLKLCERRAGGTEFWKALLLNLHPDVS